MERIINILAIGILLGWNLGCQSESHPDSSSTSPSSEFLPSPLPPTFNTQSAYEILDSLLQLGARVPGTPAHFQARELIVHHLQQLADRVTVQSDRVRRFDGHEIPVYNIVAEFTGHNPKTILLMTHWDSRFVADYDSVQRELPILGADDGGSGTAILLTLAQVFAEHPPPISIRMIFFDAEDQGAPPWITNPPAHSYCLGAQVWSARHRPDQYVADYGILLDMVGGQDARFLQEGWSQQFAGRYVSKLWTLAQSLGFSPPFIALPTDPITDDHYYVNTQAGIPTLNIINYDHRRPKRFPWYWHTHADNIEIIDTTTLGCVGTLLLHLIYRHNGFLVSS